MKLLITGSRDASPAMLSMARTAVVRASLRGWMIVVGDALGVDQAVIFECIKSSVPFECYGITPRARNFQGENFMVYHWEQIGTYTQVTGDYLARDRRMVEICDRCFAIWNGRSRGTKYTFDYAVKLGKQADIRRPQ